VHIAVCVKQVFDPDTPSSAFRVDGPAAKVIPVPGIPSVVNGFDMHAVEAALRIKDRGPLEGVHVSILSVGARFVMDAMKKPLAMGADDLILVDDPLAEELDGFATARVLRALIDKTGPYDLVLCGRQASDWDQAFVPIGLAELLELPCVSLARSIEVSVDGEREVAIVERALVDGYQRVESSMPALVSVSNELGEPRFATLRGIMAATKKIPTVFTLSDVGIDASVLVPELTLKRLFIPDSDRECEFIMGDQESDSGRLLALRLREVGLI